MIIIPAVDIKSGRAVRLIKGQADKETVYDQDPLAPARRWYEAGAKRIHIVDLDGAFDGVPKNQQIVLDILEAFSDVEIEIGGGLRTKEAIQTYMDAGAARCVLGTKAAEDRAFLTEVANAFPGKINLGLDAKDGLVATKGWVEVSEIKATDLVQELKGLPLGEVIYTDIDRDGMLQGPNLERLKEIQEVSSFPVIASGGVSTLENIHALLELNPFGAIIGKALYDGRMEISEALDLCKT